MAFVQCTGLSHAFGVRTIFNNASVFLKSGTRAALAGPNGAGKTTLMKVLTGLFEPDTVQRAIQKGTRISYLPQAGLEFPDLSVYEAAETAYREIEQLIQERDRLGARLEKKEYEDTKLDQLLEEFHHITESIDNSGYWRRKERIYDVLTGLGFSESKIQTPVKALSAGWQMRLGLAKVLLEFPDIMLLDEPTNYLDIEARTWLENYLSKYEGGYLIVSHDRSFLDACVNEVYELWNGALERYQGNYSSYEKRRKQELAQLIESWEAQQEEIARIEEFINRFRFNESKASLVQSRIKQLEKIEPIIIPEGFKRVHFRLPQPPHCGNIALTLDNISKHYDNLCVIPSFSRIFDSGKKIAFVGPNGAGKTTLMRILAGKDTNFGGTLKYGSGVTIGFFSQETVDSLNSSRSVVDEAEADCPFNLIPQVRNLLGAFLFRGDDIYKPISVLSGGERSRLGLLKLLMHPANLLVLDEPTNHLDLDSKDVLLEALKNFPGTVIFVSHDKFFIDSLAEEVLELSCGKEPRLYNGNYAYYIEKKAILDGNENSEDVEQKKESVQSGSRQYRELEKQKKADQRRLQRREEELVTSIGVEEEKLTELHNSLSLPVNYSDGAKAKALQEAIAACESTITILHNEWEAVTTELARYSS